MVILWCLGRTFHHGTNPRFTMVLAYDFWLGKRENKKRKEKEKKDEKRRMESENDSTIDQSTAGEIAPVPPEISTTSVKTCEKDESKSKNSTVARKAAHGSVSDRNGCKTDGKIGM